MPALADAGIKNGAADKQLSRRPVNVGGQMTVGMPLCLFALGVEGVVFVKNLANGRTYFEIGLIVEVGK